MSKTEYTENQKLHHYLGIELNMQTWNLLGKKDRTEKDDTRMIAFAKGSEYHWLKSPHFQPVNEQRGKWLISHVYAVLGKGREAMKAAGNCLSLTEKHQFKDFDLGYALEAVARAHAASGEKEKAREFFDKAKSAGEKIIKEGDKNLFLSDLSAEPWFDSLD